MLTGIDYCDYELRLGLRDIGYPMSTCQINDGPIQMPKITLYEAHKWLRKEKGIHITINYIRLEEDIFMYTLRYIGQKLREGGGLYNNEQYSSYEEALSEGINESVKILEEK